MVKGFKVLVVVNTETIRVGNVRPMCEVTPSLCAGSTPTQVKVKVNDGISSEMSSEGMVNGGSTVCVIGIRPVCKGFSGVSTLTVKETSI